MWVPDAEHEALRNPVRARTDAKADELRAKHRLSKFLLRQGVHAPAGVGLLCGPDPRPQAEAAQ